MDINTVIAGWVNHIIGDPLLAAILIVMFFVVLGIKMNWSLDMFAVVIVPLFALMVYSMGILPPWTFALLAVVGGVIIGMAMLRTLFR
jgi:hypothetical protein